MKPENLNFILGLTTLASVAVTVYNSLKRPQEISATKDAVFDERLKSVTDIVINLRDNHLHTLDQKFDKHVSDNQAYVEKDIAWKARMEALLENINKK
jgi:hypothetical protein